MKLKGANSRVGRSKTVFCKVEKAKDNLPVGPIRTVVKADFFSVVPLNEYLVLGDLVALVMDQCETFCDQVSEHEGLQAQS